MKKKFLSIFLIFSAMVATAALFSCNKSSGNDDDNDTEDVVKSDKISADAVYKLSDKFKKGEFTDADYNQALDMYEAYADVHLSKIKSLVYSCNNYDEWRTEMDRYVQKEFGYIDELLNIVDLMRVELHSVISHKTKDRLEKMDEDFTQKFYKIEQIAEEKFGRSSVGYAEADSNSVAVREAYSDYNAYDDYYYEPEEFEPEELIIAEDYAEVVEAQEADW